MSRYTADIDALFSKFDKIRSRPNEYNAREDSYDCYKSEGTMLIYISIETQKYQILGYDSKNGAQEKWTIRKSNPKTRSSMNFSKSEEKVLNARGFKIELNRRECADMERGYKE
jgi:hypothetical protein